MTQQQNLACLEVCEQATPGVVDDPWLKAASHPDIQFIVQARDPLTGYEAVLRENLRLMEENERLRKVVDSIPCGDCKDGVLYCDSLLFDLDREDEDQPCPRCTAKKAALGAPAQEKENVK